ncbi:uncharacterized protein [Apostichopus japonicus]|uniref:uncharacterized protein isoform X2 n=1 Tax=Stichopus japonicus TaxID=307972 RepID=UPI003AB83711
MDPTRLRTSEILPSEQIPVGTFSQKPCHCCVAKVRRQGRAIEKQLVVEEELLKINFNLVWREFNWNDGRSTSNGIGNSPMAAYNSLQDKNLVGYFNNNRMRRHLRKSGLINRRGEIVTESSYRLTMARKEHQGHVRDLMAQAIVHKALDMERHRQASIKRKLEEIAKVKLVQRVRFERARKGDEDITPFLSPRAPQGRPHSAQAQRRRSRLGSNQRPLTAPTNKTSSDRQNTVYVDEDGFPIHRERRRSNTSEEIDSHNLRELDPKIMNNVSIHMRPEDREGLAPYKVNQSFEPHPPTAHVKSKRSRPRPQKSKTVINKDGKKLRPKSHKGSLTLHRKEPAFPHAGQLQTNCDVTVRYRGSSLKLQYEREDLRDEIMVYQQHCGGENLIVFEGMAEPGTDLVFTSRRHRGYPFSVTFFVNRVQSLRLSACCEYKYTPHCLLGGAKGHFKFIRVEGASPCYRCMVEAELARRERQRYRGTQTDQPDPPPEPEPEMTVIATQTEETGEEESKDGYEDDFDEDDEIDRAKGKESSDETVAPQTMNQSVETSDHFFSGSEKSEKKDKEGYSDSEFEDESDKEDSSKVVVQEQTNGGQDGSEDVHSEVEEEAGRTDRSINEKVTTDKETDDEVASLRSEVTKDVEEGEESVREEDVDGGEASVREKVDKGAETDDVVSVKSEADQKYSDPEERIHEDVTSGQREESVKASNGGNEEGREEEQKVVSTPGMEEKEEDSESESEVKPGSSDEEEVTSVRSRSRASLSNSEDDYRPLSPSSSSSDSEDEKENRKGDKTAVRPEEMKKGSHEDKVGEELVGNVQDEVVDGVKQEDSKIEVGVNEEDEVKEDGQVEDDSTVNSESGKDNETSGDVVSQLTEADKTSDVEKEDEEKPGEDEDESKDEAHKERKNLEEKKTGRAGDSEKDEESQRDSDPKQESQEDDQKRNEEAEATVDVEDESNAAASMKEDVEEEKDEVKEELRRSVPSDEGEGVDKDAGSAVASEEKDIDQSENGEGGSDEMTDRGDDVREIEETEETVGKVIQESELRKEEEEDEGEKEVTNLEGTEVRVLPKEGIPLVTVNYKPEGSSTAGSEDNALQGSEEEEESKQDMDLNENKINDVDGNDGIEEQQSESDIGTKEDDGVKEEAVTKVDVPREVDEVDDNTDGVKEGEEVVNAEVIEEEDQQQQQVEKSVDAAEEKESAKSDKEGETGGSASEDEDGGEEVAVSSSSSDDDETQSAVTVLNLNEKGITSDRAVKLAASLLKQRYSQVQYLLVRSNPIEDRGLTAIVQSLIKLNGRAKEDGEPGLALTHLDLGNTQISNKGINELAEFLKLPSRLENLNLSDNAASKLGWLALAAGVRENTSLKTLSVEYMKLGDEGCREICEAVADSKTVTEINLEGNDIGETGGEAILKMLQDNERIQTVNFERDNSIPSHIGQEIKDLL